MRHLVGQDGELAADVWIVVVEEQERAWHSWRVPGRTGGHESVNHRRLGLGGFVQSAVRGSRPLRAGVDVLGNLRPCAGRQCCDHDDRSRSMKHRNLSFRCPRSGLEPSIRRAAPAARGTAGIRDYWEAACSARKFRFFTVNLTLPFCTGIASRLPANVCLSVLNGPPFRYPSTSINTCGHSTVGSA